MSDQPVDVRGPDEDGACIQLAARWAERYASSEDNENRAEALKRFRSVYAYLDAVVHGVEPPAL